MCLEPELDHMHAYADAMRSYDEGDYKAAVQGFNRAMALMPRTDTPEWKLASFYRRQAANMTRGRSHP